jgi:hypothetical protein
MFKGHSFRLLLCLRAVRALDIEVKVLHLAIAVFDSGSNSLQLAKAQVEQRLYES